MDFGKFLLALGAVASVFGILAACGFVLPGPQIVRRIKSRIEASHKQREAEAAAHRELPALVQALEGRVTELERQVKSLRDDTGQLAPMIEGVRLPEYPILLPQQPVLTLPQLTARRTQQIVGDAIAKAQDTPRGVPMSDAPLEH